MSTTHGPITTGAERSAAKLTQTYPSYISNGSLKRGAGAVVDGTENKAAWRP